MKNINKIIFGKDAKLSGILALSIIMAIALGCTCKGLDNLKELSKNDKPANSAENKNSKTGSVSDPIDDSPFPADVPTPTPKKIVTPVNKSSDKNMPSDEETEVLVKDLIQQFKNGVENEDFSDMRNASSSAFKKTYTETKIKTSFDVFIQAKERVGTVLEDIDGLTPEYTSPPSIVKKNGYKILTANGTFATSPTTTFNTSYVLEKGVWKMLTIEIKIK
jgi:hypothetical protein